MTPSNRHPGTAVHRSRRAFLLQAAGVLLAALLAAPAPAHAQGLIQFSVGAGSFTRYQVRDDGTGLRTLSFPQVTYPYIKATARSDYWSGLQYVGRLYLYPRQDGTLPGTQSPYYNLMVWSEATGESRAVTDINGPLYVQSNNNWSNDGLDSFFSLTLVDSATGEHSIYRVQVTADEIASPDFRPITLADIGARLEYVAGDMYNVPYWWSHDGSRFYYVDTRDRTVVRVKTVGFGVTRDDDPIVFIAPATLGILRVNPPSLDPLNPVSDRYLVANSGKDGILAMDRETGTWQWLATQTSTGLSDIRGPVFSPDGSFIAFGGTRYDSRKTPYYGVYKVPFFGGQVTRVTEVKGSKNTGGYSEVNNWNIP